MKGDEKLVLTGQLGDVMKESARIALSYVRSHATELGIDESAFDDATFHVHVPAGAIPKDGPSAGITMTTALASLLSGRPGEAHRRDDRRGDAAGPRAADRRAEAEGARRARRRADRRDRPRAEPRRPRRRPRGRARGDDVPPGDDPRRGARARARARGRDAVQSPRSTHPGAARGGPPRGGPPRAPLGARDRLRLARAARSASTSSSSTIVGIPPRTLAQRLDELEQAGILERARPRRAARRASSTA